MKKNTRDGIIILVALLAIGFAVVTTNLIINGTARLDGNIDGLVYFTKAIPETGGTATIEPNARKTITYSTKDLAVVGDKAVLDYTVLNDSSQYDVDVTMSIEFVNAATVNEYFDITYTGFEPATNENDHKVRIIGKQSADGKVEVRLKKLLTEGELHLGFTITLNVVAVSRSVTATAPSTTQDASIDSDGHDYNYNSCDHSHDGELVYYDPVTENECSKSTFSVDAINAGTSTSYAWRIINNCDGDYVMQLDHSLAETIWASEDDEFYARNASDNYPYKGAGYYGPITALKKLEEVTSTWVRLEPINYTYTANVEIATGSFGVSSEEYGYDGSYGTLNCVVGSCSVSVNSNYKFTTNLRARLITYEDIRAIYGNNNPTKLIDNAKEYDVLITSSSGLDNAQLNVGNSLWWLHENVLINSSFFSSGATETPYTDEAENTIRCPNCVRFCDYWTLTPGAKEPGIAGVDLVGYPYYALAVDYSIYLANYSGPYYSDGKWVGGVDFHRSTNAFSGIRPVVSVPTNDVRFDSE